MRELYLRFRATVLETWRGCHQLPFGAPKEGEKQRQHQNIIRHYSGVPHRYVHIVTAFVSTATQPREMVQRRNAPEDCRTGTQQAVTMRGSTRRSSIFRSIVTPNPRSGIPSLQQLQLSTFLLFSLQLHSHTTSYCTPLYTPSTCTLVPSQATISSNSSPRRNSALLAHLTTAFIVEPRNQPGQASHSHDNFKCTALHPETVTVPSLRYPVTSSSNLSSFLCSSHTASTSYPSTSHSTGSTLR
ncbi:hypothetical protein QR685DRAFT_260982 [Neurospora intermedia]|uniref:Uncharacterized protein n=1 Tax=Neurospora intermedia TaxID=5142 RepID=A0ABR3DFM0_NEUIN